MATIRRRAGKHGVSWRAEVCVGGVRKSATFDSKSQAYAWAEEMERRLREGLPLPGESPDADMDFVQAAERYEEKAGRRRKANTKMMYRYCVVRLTRAFAGKTLRGVTRKDIIDYRDQRKAEVGPASIIHDFSFLRGLYRTARLEWGIDVECPVRDVKPPSPPKNRNVLLTRPAIDKLLEACKQSKTKDLYALVLIMLHTAMRPSEAAGLRWRQVLWDARMLDLTETKTDPRRVPLTNAALKVLRALSEKSKSEWVFLPPGAEPRDPVLSNYFRTAWRNACKRAGLRCTMYTLRHTAASYLVMNGVPLGTVKEIMGHKDISQTMRYTHFLDAHKLEAIEAIGDLGV